MPKPLIKKNGEVRELRAGDEVALSPLKDAFPELAAWSARKRGRPKSAAPKMPVKLRIAPDVLAAYKASGKGWQTRMNRVLRDAVEEGKI